MDIAAGLIEEMIYNVLLWTPGKGDAKKSLSEGLVEVNYDNEGKNISFLSTDGYVSVRTGTTDKSIRSSRLFVTGVDLKAGLPQLSRIESTIEVEVAVVGTEFWIGPGVSEIVTPKTDIGFWNYMSNIMYTSIEPDRPGDPFAVDPRRLTKFSLLEPRDKYPVDMIQRQVSGAQPVLFWKHGPRTRGIISPLSRETLEETFVDERGVLW